MANNLTSNVTRQLIKGFLKAFESSRVLTKTVNTQLLSGKFNPSSGSTVDFKRPHDYKTIRTSDGDISSSTKSDIISGKATGTVQDYITEATEWGNLEEALELDELDTILMPMAERMVTDLEVDFGQYMIENSGLHYGAPGTVVDAWADVAGAGALMKSIGVPNEGKQHYVMNPFSSMNLADAQNGLTAADQLVRTAWENAQISKNFGGMRAITSNALKSRTSSDAADRAGTLSANPTVTYVGAKDTMTQSLAVAGLSANAVVKAGDIVTIAGRYRLNLSTREPIFDATGAQIIWSGVVTADVTLSGTGTGTIVVTGPAIYEANGQYNTVDSAPVSGDVITILGTASTVYQPNLFYHEQAFGIGTVKLPKLYSTDTVAVTADGMSIRCSKYSDGDSNTQKVRFDLVPAYATFNPFFAGQGYGL